MPATPLSSPDVPYPFRLGAGNRPVFRTTMPESLPFGLSCGHTWHEVGAILRFLNLAKVSTFVELGVHEGGLASILVSRCLFHMAFTYLGVEINGQIPREELHRAMRLVPHGAATILVGDCLGEQVRERVRGVILQSAGPVFIYCDDGNKPAELAYYAGLPRIGDFIGVHDFHDGVRQVLDMPDFPDPVFPIPEVLPDDLDPVRDRFEVAYPPIFEDTRTAVFRCVVPV